MAGSVIEKGTDAGTVTVAGVEMRRVILPDAGRAEMEKSEFLQANRTVRNQSAGHKRRAKMDHSGNKVASDNPATETVADRIHTGGRRLTRNDQWSAGPRSAPITGRTEKANRRREQIVSVCRGDIFAFIGRCQAGYYTLTADARKVVVWHNERDRRAAENIMVGTYSMADVARVARTSNVTVTVTSDQELLRMAVDSIGGFKAEIRRAQTATHNSRMRAKLAAKESAGDPEAIAKADKRRADTALRVRINRFAKRAGVDTATARAALAIAGVSDPADLPEGFSIPTV
jgi:hypothetical protein